MACISDGDLALQGSLGSLSLSDLTPHGDLYRERFTTRGGEALIFNIHKYATQLCQWTLCTKLREDMMELVCLYFGHSDTGSLILIWSESVTLRCPYKWPQCSTSTPSAFRLMW